MREFEPDAGRGWGGAMLDGEIELTAGATQVQIGVTPGMELGRAAQRVSGAHAAGGFAGVIHHEHGEAVLSLQGTQVCKQRGDFTAGLLIDAMQPHERVEYQQGGLSCLMVCSTSDRPADRGARWAP